MHAIMVLTLFVLSAGADEALPSLPAYECPYLDHELEVASATDGNTWRIAPAARLVNVVDGSDPETAAVFRALWSNTNFYLRVDCEDADVRGELTGHDGPVYREDVVEVFLNPSGDRETYYEIDVNRLNTVFDALIMNPGDLTKGSVLKDWNSRGLRISVEVRQGTEQGGEVFPGWTVTFAIPFEEMITAPHRPPVPGDRWRWNVYRIDRGADGDEFQAWSPTGAVDFHVPGRFGILEFVR